MNKLAGIITVALSGALSLSAWAQCDIGVLSEDARFIVLNSDLQLVDSGNLWWLGLRSIDGVASKSTIENTAVISSNVVNVQDGVPLHDEGRSEPFQGVFLLPNLGRHYLSQNDVSYYEVDGVETTHWIKHLGGNHLIRLQFNDQSKFIYQLDDSLQLEGDWETDELSAGLAICSNQEHLIFGGLDNKLELNGDNQILTRIDSLDRISGYRLTDIADSCNVLASKLNGPNDIMMQSAIVDLMTGNITSEFTRNRYINGLLFDDGKKFLQQDLSIEVVGPNAVKSAPSNVFRIVDTASGNTILEKAIGTGEAELIGKASCNDEGESKTALLAGSDQIFLLDLDTLDFITSPKIPFSGKFYLF